MWRLVELSATHDLPFQIHTGHGQLQGSNPLLLLDLIEANPKTKFILFHGGYPWVGETGAILLRHSRHVWIDSVWLPTLSYTMAKRAYQEWLEMVPSDRIMWGADTVQAEGIYAATEFTRQCLADSYLASGLSKEAVAAYRRVVADRERAVGPDHLDTTRARHGLGAAYLRTGKSVAAERAYEQAQAGFERVLGPRHPDTLRNRAELALVYRQLGRYGDARALLRDTIDRLERILPRRDPLIVELREVLADIGDE